MTHEEKLVMLTTKRYDVVTHSIAMIDHKNIDIVGIPLTEINGEVYENHSAVIETKFTIGKILKTFSNNIPISLKWKRRLTEYLSDFEELMDLLSVTKSRNRKESSVIIPNSDDVNIETLIAFYNTLVQNNKRVIKNEYGRELEDQFNLIPRERLIENNSEVFIDIGDKIREPSNRFKEFSKPKKYNNEGLRDGY